MWAPSPRGWLSSQQLHHCFGISETFFFFCLADNNFSLFYYRCLGTVMMFSVTQQNLLILQVCCLHVLGEVADPVTAHVLRGDSSQVCGAGPLCLPPSATLGNSCWLPGETQAGILLFGGEGVAAKAVGMGKRISGQSEEQERKVGPPLRGHGWRGAGDGDRWPLR